MQKSIRQTSASDFCFWLKADIQPLEIEVRFTPNSGHSEAHAGLPLLTHSGSRGSPIRDTLYRRLQPFRHLHDCSGCFRLERSPGGTCTRTRHLRFKENHRHRSGYVDNSLPRVLAHTHRATTTALSLRNPMVDPNRSFATNGSNRPGAAVQRGGTQGSVCRSRSGRSPKALHTAGQLFPEIWRL